MTTEQKRSSPGGLRRARRRSPQRVAEWAAEHRLCLQARAHDRLRYGARIDLTHHGQTFQLLSVHLKSGCFDNATTSSACETLLAQIPVLEGWIDAAAEGHTPFIVLGDFNRQFTQPNDQLWADLDDGEPANADLTTVTQDMSVSCRNNTFTEFIDHIVVDRWVLP